MNYKLEKFWNGKSQFIKDNNLQWTINLKSFEILFLFPFSLFSSLWTINLKSFEIGREIKSKKFLNEWTINLKSFEIDYYSKIVATKQVMNYKLEKFWNL